MAGELFKLMAGVNLVHVPYRGQGPAMNDLLGGQLQVIFATTPGTTEFVRAGKLRARQGRGRSRTIWRRGKAAVG
jgi:tripartite-type tricarboxylate transporter receptor subunit TctC